jgi:hypothetical protein
MTGLLAVSVKCSRGPIEVREQGLTEQEPEWRVCGKVALRTYSLTTPL